MSMNYYLVSTYYVQIAFITTFKSHQRLDDFIIQTDNY